MSSSHCDDDAEVDIPDVECDSILNIDRVVERPDEVEEFECIDVLDMECVDKWLIEVDYVEC